MILLILAAFFLGGGLGLIFCGVLASNKIFEEHIRLQKELAENEQLKQFLKDYHYSSLDDLINEYEQHEDDLK